jgi:hypothetical protein
VTESSWWRVVVDKRRSADDPVIETHVASVRAPTAQAALRQLVLTSTDNALIVRVEVRVETRQEPEG